jgi:DNA-binding NarL/FixJ family response regulator
MSGEVFSIVLIDESDVIGSRLKSLLASTPVFRLSAHAHSISEGYDVCESQVPRIVLLDSWLPDGTGLSMIETLRNKNPSAIILILSNSGNQYYKEKCLELGANGVIDKSNELPELVEILHKLVQAAA